MRVQELQISGCHVGSSLQDDFAKRPILDQMTQGFARLAKGIHRSTIGLTDPLTISGMTSRQAAANIS
jgi:hypothetical protein